MVGVSRMNVNDKVQWDVRSYGMCRDTGCNEPIISVKSGTIVAKEGDHLVIQLPAEPGTAYISPFVLRHASSVRRVEMGVCPLTDAAVDRIDVLPFNAVALELVEDRGHVH